MNTDDAVVTNDLKIMEEMAANMAAYLDSDAVDWTMPRAHMPRLTIGGYLMRQQRLLALKDELPSAEQARLAEAMKQFDDALKERVVRFETRAHQELHKRISEWIAILRDLSRRAQMEAGHYAAVVDTRVVIEALLHKLDSRPYKLREGVRDEISAIDQLLNRRFVKDGFVWDPVWTTAYPSSEYWWLYGRPD